MMIEKQTWPRKPHEGQKERKKTLPTNYRCAAKYVRIATEEKRDVMELIDQDRHFRTGRTIVGRVLSNSWLIDAVIARVELAVKEPQLNPWLMRVLISELLFGSGRLIGDSVPVQRLLKYQTQLQSALEEAMNNKKKLKAPRFVRVNTSVLSVEGAKRLLAEKQWILVEDSCTDYGAFIERVKNLGENEYIQDYHFPELLVFPLSAKMFWSKHQHLRDQFFLQDKACLLPPYLLNPSSRSVVMDMCAAPGLKTTHLACLMKNKGRIYAVERDQLRYKTLCRYVKPFGVVKTINGDALEVKEEDVPGVEFVLIDPSCSGSGMLHRKVLNEEVDTERLYKLAGLQYKLLMHAMNAFPNVRRIVYSTCSMHQEENEKVVQSVLQHNGHFRLLDARKELGKEWLNVGSSDYPGIGERCLYAKTEDDLTIGMFVAVFERCPEGVVNEAYEAYEKQKLSYSRQFRKRGRRGGIQDGQENNEEGERNEEEQMHEAKKGEEESREAVESQGASKRKSKETKQERVDRKKLKVNAETEVTDEVVTVKKKNEKKKKSEEELPLEMEMKEEETVGSDSNKSGKSKKNTENGAPKKKK